MTQENLPGMLKYDIGTKVNVVLKRNSDHNSTYFAEAKIASFTVGRKKVVVDFGNGEYKLVPVEDIMEVNS